MGEIESIVLRIAILGAGVFGLVVASYIRHKKTMNQVLVCPMNSDCHAVVHSDYSRFLGIPVESLGVAYYGMFSLSYLSTLLFPELFTNTVELILGSVAGGAMAFSIYLFSVQAFIIRQWCFWCLLSFAASVTVFVLFVVV